jgi:hypothetical protein
MEKVFRTADIRELDNLYDSGEISYTALVEKLNEMAHNHYVVNRNCNLQNVSKVKRAVCLKKTKRLYCNTYIANEYTCPKNCPNLKQTDC